MAHLDYNFDITRVIREHRAGKKVARQNALATATDDELRQVLLNKHLVELTNCTVEEIEAEIERRKKK